MNIPNTPRVAAGTPAGGRFAPTARTAADLDDMDLELGSESDLNISRYQGRAEDLVPDPVTLDAPLPRLKPREQRLVTTPRTDISAEAHRRIAAEQNQLAADSWERSDTDGFLSQWANGINARLHSTQADIEDSGGKAEFLALADTEGNLIPAKLVSTRFGAAWGRLSDPTDPHSAFDGWVNRSSAATAEKRRAALAKKGYREVTVRAPAKAKIIANGTGLSGAASAYVGIVRTDGGFSPDAEIVSLDGDSD